MGRQWASNLAWAVACRAGPISPPARQELSSPDARRNIMMRYQDAMSPLFDPAENVVELNQ